MERPLFYYSVASPWCYLAGERVNHAFETVPVWQPVLVAAADVDRDEVERAAAAQGLPALRWPETFPFDEVGRAHQLMSENRHPNGNMAILVGAARRGLTDLSERTA